jgi:hypothetical protein
MYSSKVKSSMTINNKTGEVSLNDFGVDVNGFSNPSLLSKARENYNLNKDLPKSYCPEGWPEGTWYDLYWDMWRNFLKWKKKRVYS